MSDVLDLKPRLLAKRRSECGHEYVDVGMTAAELECRECHAPLDPWWFIRRLAKSSESIVEDAERQAAAKLDECNKAIARTNETLRGLHEEIKALQDTRNRLANEIVSGKHVGFATARRRRKS